MHVDGRWSLCSKNINWSVHLYSQDPKGVEVQFYLFMIVYLLLLLFKELYSDPSQCPILRAYLEPDKEKPDWSSLASVETDPGGLPYVRGLVSRQ